MSNIAQNCIGSQINMDGAPDVEVHDLHTEASQQNPAANDWAVRQFIHHCSNCDHGVGSSCPLA
jgi:hypothetical protein